MDETPDWSETSDAELVAAYYSCSEEAFEELRHRYEGALFAYLLRRTARNRELANNLLQEVWLRVQKSKTGDNQTYNSKYTPRQWLFTLAYRVLLDHFRKQQRDITVEDPVLPGEETEQPLTSTKPSREFSPEEEAAFNECLSKLPEHLHEVWVLRRMAGLKTQEVADIIGVGIGTVSKREHRAKEWLWNCMNGNSLENC